MYRDSLNLISRRLCFFLFLWRVSKILTNVWATASDPWLCAFYVQFMHHIFTRHTSSGFVTVYMHYIKLPRQTMYAFIKISIRLLGSRVWHIWTFRRFMALPFPTHLWERFWLRKYEFSLEGTLSPAGNNSMLEPFSQYSFLGEYFFLNNWA